jgi:hypothetical protein
MKNSVIAPVELRDGALFTVVDRQCRLIRDGKPCMFQSLLLNSNDYEVVPYAENDKLKNGSPDYRR